jgi:feruloyl esterase
VFEDPKWDFRTLNFDGDPAKAMKKDGGVLSATDPDLRPFFAHGGKLVQYHGWTDQQVMPENSINYYKSVVATVGQAKVDASYRLFMAPGMNHWGAGTDRMHSTCWVCWRVGARRGGTGGGDCVA